jgi:hypothetical protein
MKKKTVFNHRFSRARRYVERAFGILTNKWTIFHLPINFSPDFAVDIVKACTVHNIVREKDGYNFEDILTTGLVNLTNGQIVRVGLAANRIRDTFAEYFLCDVGLFPWELTRI